MSRPVFKPTKSDRQSATQPGQSGRRDAAARHLTTWPAVTGRCDECSNEAITCLACVAAYAQRKHDRKTVHDRARIIIRPRSVPRGPLALRGLRLHTLEAGCEPDGRPSVLLLHRFPEFAYSWRKMIPSIAAAGYHVMAPDLRGYGCTTGCDDHDGDVTSFRMLNAACDPLCSTPTQAHRHHGSGQLFAYFATPS